MKRSIYYLTGCLALAIVPTASEAAIEVHSLLQISNFKIFVDAKNGTDIVDRPLTGSFSPVTTGDVRITLSSNLATTNASLNGVTVGPLDSALGSLDAPTAYVPGLGNLDPPPGPNDFTSPYTGATVGPYSRGDFDGGGSVLDVVDPLNVTISPAGASADGIADIVVPNTVGIDNTGSSDASGGNSSQFRFQTGTSSLVLYVSFDAMLDMLLGYTGLPTGLELSATSGYTISLNGTSPGGSVNFDFTPSSLTNSIYRNTAGTTSIVVPTTTFTSAKVTLPANGSYSFSINQNVTSELGAVPEPQSILVWALLLSSIGLVSIRRMRALA